MKIPELNVPPPEITSLIERSRNFPALLHIDITNHCNKNCSFCCLHDRYKKKQIPIGDMDWAMYKSIIDQSYIYQRQEMIVDLSNFGEALLYPKLYEAIRYARDYEIETRITTNGLLLYEKRKAILDGDLDRIIISMFDPSAVEPTKKFLEYRGKRIRPKVLLKSFSNTTWQPPLALCKMADDHVISHIRHWLTSDKKRSRMIPCFKLLCNPSVTWDGEFNLCCIDCWREGVVGNLNYDSIDKLWPIMRFIYMQQQKGYYLPPCDRCLRFDND